MTKMQIDYSVMLIHRRLRGRFLMATLTHHEERLCAAIYARTHSAQEIDP